MPEGVELAVAYVSIVPEGSKIAPEVRKQFGAAGVEAGKAGKVAGKKFGGAFGSGLKLLGGAFIGSQVVSFLKDSNAEAREAQKVGARTANVIKTTGGAANISAKQVGALSTAISNKVGIDDEAIQSGANLLLTFKNVRNEAGKGNKVFDRATKAAVDLSASGFGDLSGASKQLGKALNDPVKGISALGRAGVTFTDQQKDQIKTLVKSGKTLQAQKIILKEVESQVGGAGEAQATAGDKAAVAIKNLKEQIGTALLPVVDRLANFTTKKAVPAISKFVKGFEKGTGAGGDIRDVLEDIVGVGKGVFKFFNSLPGPVKKFGAELGVAYLALSKIKSLQIAQTLSSMAGGFKNAETRAGTFSKAARNAAGVGGLVLLANGLQQADQDTRTLQTTLGGAAAGFAIAGPVGGAVGALGGFATAMFTGRDATKKAVIEIANFNSALDVNTGKLKKNAVQQIIASTRKESPEVFQAASALGISDKQVGLAISGNKKAQAEIQKTLDLVSRLDDQPLIPVTLPDGTKAELFALDELRGALDGVFNPQGVKTNSDGLIKTFADQAAQAKKNARQIRDMRSALAGLPKRVVTKLTNDKSGDVSLKQINALAEKYNKTPKQIRTLLKLEGLKPAENQLSDFSGKVDRATRDRTVKITVSTNATVADQAPPFPGGRDGNPKTPYPRKLGGTVRKGFPYRVGEVREELFVPNQAGRIIPRVPTAASMSAPISLAGQHLTLRIGGRQIEGVIEEIATSMVDSASAMRGETDRAL